VSGLACMGRSVLGWAGLGWYKHGVQAYVAAGRVLCAGVGWAAGQLLPQPPIEHVLFSVVSCSPGASSACGALIACTSHLKSEGLEANVKTPGVHDPLEPE
jgi:hypothetical protein